MCSKIIFRLPNLFTCSTKSGYSLTVVYLSIYQWYFLRWIQFFPGKVLRSAYSSTWSQEFPRDASSGTLATSSWYFPVLPSSGQGICTEITNLNNYNSNREEIFLRFWKVGWSGYIIQTLSIYSNSPHLNEYSFSIWFPQSLL